MYNILEYKNYSESITKSKTFNKEIKDKYLKQIKELEEHKSKVILNTYHLSNLIGIKWNYFKELINNPEKYYHQFNITKKSGGFREICAPNYYIDLCQRFIKEEILDDIKISKFAHGFAEEKSIITNAKKHLNQEVVLNIDLKDFFPSIGKKKVFYIFNKICGYDYNLSHCLSKLVMFEGGLPQGACTSPIISNIVSYKLDLRLSKLAESKGINYTRYADDMTFSGSKEIINKKLLYTVVLQLM